MASGSIPASSCKLHCVTTYQWASCHQVVYFFGAEYTAAREEAHALGRLEREAGATARHHVDYELRVPPVLELCGADIDRASLNRTEEYILVANPEFVRQIAHGRAAV